METRLIGATILTQDAAGTIIDDGELAFDSRGVITYVGPRRGDGDAARSVINLTGKLLLPGLINAHTHSAMTLLRGSCDDEDLATWLGVVQALEQHMRTSDVAVGLELAMVEMIRSGTTTFADMYHWDAELLGLVADAGMRVVAAHATFDFDTVGFAGLSPMDGRASLDHTEALAAEFAGEDLIRVRYGPHAPYTCSPEMLSEVRRRAEVSGLGIHIHLSESAFEVEQSLKNFGRTPIAHADALGLLEVPTLIAHAVHAGPEDIEILAECGAGVAHNPASNLKLGSGIFPFKAMRDAGVLCALGTDGAASNNSLDMFDEMKLATIIHRGVAQDPVETAGTDVLNLATREGAQAVGFPETGSFEVGKQADAITLRTDTAHATPMPSPSSFLTFAARGSDVDDVFIAGRQIMREGALLTVDEAEIRDRAARAAARLQSLAHEE